MAYSRPVLPGIGLKQKPAATSPAQTGVQQTTLDVDIATTSSVGVVQVGSGLSITPTGVLSAINSGFINVTLTSINYIVTATDYYIGVLKKDIEITLPLGIIGKVYVIKNQINGNIEVNTSGGQQIDNASDKTLGSGSSMIVVFDGTRWNII
jgi:hypothetical protein